MGKEINSIVEAGFVAVTTPIGGVYKVTGVVIADQNLDCKRVGLKDYIQTAKKAWNGDYSSIKIYPMHKNYDVFKNELLLWSDDYDYYIADASRLGNLGVEFNEIIKVMESNNIGYNPNYLKNSLYMVIMKKVNPISEPIFVFSFDSSVFVGDTVINSLFSNGETAAPFATFYEGSKGLTRFAKAYYRNGMITFYKEEIQSKKDGVDGASFKCSGLAAVISAGVPNKMGYPIRKVANVCGYYNSPSIKSGIKLFKIGENFIGVHNMYWLSLDCESHIDTLRLPQDCEYLRFSNINPSYLNNLSNLVLNSKLVGGDGLGFLGKLPRLNSIYFSKDWNNSRIIKIASMIFEFEYRNRGFGSVLREVIESHMCKDVTEALSTALFKSCGRKINFIRQ